MTAGLLKLLAVLGGGAVGAGLRWGLAELVHQWLGRGFPWGTLAVNLLGSLAIGWLWAWLPPAGMPHLRLLLVTGLLGGFTTYSAFSLETLALVQGGQAGRAAAYVALTVALCFAAVWAGHQGGRWLHAGG